jgi:hypothetical protein
MYVPVSYVSVSYLSAIYFAHSLQFITQYKSILQVRFRSSAKLSRTTQTAVTISRPRNSHGRELKLL